MLFTDNANLNTNFNEDPTDHISSKLDEAESLTAEARQLLVQCEGALNGEGVREEALVLERWLESYRRGVSAAQKLTNTGPELLGEMNTRLRQSLEELHRYEEEGGNPASKTQQAQIEALNRAMCAIHKLSDSLKDAALVTNTKTAVAA